MLGFLRRIRRSLIEEGQLRKYLVYAVGEILLVMIGILLALQVNNWNEGKKNRALESEYLQRIAVDLKITEQSVDDKLKHWQTSAEATDFLLASLADPSLEVSSIHLAIALRRMAAIQLPASINTTYNDLQSTGNIRLLRDRTVREGIAQLYEVDLQGGRPFLENRIDFRARRIAYRLIPVKYHQAAQELCPMEIPIARCPDVGEAFDPPLVLQIQAVPHFADLLMNRRWDQESGINILMQWKQHLVVAQDIIDQELNTLF